MRFTERYQNRDFVYGNPSVCSFAILVDSFARLPRGKSYLHLVLQMVYDKYGLIGAAIRRDSARLKDYKDMITYCDAISQPLEFVMIITMGNDLYGHRTYKDRWREAALELYNFVQPRYSERVCFVVGGSAAVWGYDISNNSHAQYDDHVNKVVSVLRAVSDYVVTGANELQGISVEDEIGHVSQSSLPQVLRAYQIWIGSAIPPRRSCL